MIDRFKDDRAFELLVEDMFKQKNKENQDKALDCLLDYVDKNKPKENTFLDPSYKKELEKSVEPAEDAKLQEAIDKVVEATKEMPFNSTSKSVNIPFMTPKKYPELLKAMGQGFIITNSIPHEDRLTLEIQRG